MVRSHALVVTFKLAPETEVDLDDLSSKYLARSARLVQLDGLDALVQTAKGKGQKKKFETRVEGWKRVGGQGEGKLRPFFVVTLLQDGQEVGYLFEEYQGFTKRSAHAAHWKDVLVGHFEDVRKALALVSVPSLPSRLPLTSFAPFRRGT